MPDENVTPENIEEVAEAAEAAAQTAQNVSETANEVAQQPFSDPYVQPQVDPAQPYAQQQVYQQPYVQPQVDPAQQQYTQPQVNPAQQQYYTQQQYAQPQYQQPVYGQPAQAPYANASDPGTTPLVLGILSLVAALVFGFTFIGPIVGIVLGALGMSKGKKVLQSWPENGRAKGGRITGIIGLILSILMLVLTIVFAVFVGAMAMNAVENPDAFISQMEEIAQYDETGELQQQIDELEQQLNELNEYSQGSKPSTSPFIATPFTLEQLVPAAQIE